MSEHQPDPFNAGYCVTCHRHALYGDDITRVEWPCAVARLETVLLARVRELETALRSIQGIAYDGGFAADIQHLCRAALADAAPAPSEGGSPPC